jgi:hypothetical protein
VLNLTGCIEKALIDWVIAVGYNSSLNTVWTSHWGSLSKQNTTASSNSRCKAPVIAWGSSDDDDHRHRRHDGWWGGEEE